MSEETANSSKLDVGSSKGSVAPPTSNSEPRTSNSVEARFQDPRTIRKIYGYARTIAMVGLSPNRLRPSFFVAQYLQYRGYRVIPVNPAASEILGETAYPSLSAIPFKVDVVDVFRAPSAAPAIAEEAIKIGARALWLQFAVISPEAAELAATAGLDVVMDRCMKIEHGRYFGEMHWFGLNTGIVTARRPARVRLAE
jgi:predicted CoA-binding protein